MSMIQTTTFLDDVNDWLMHVTEVSQARLFRGFQSQEVLPDDNDYIVYTPISQTRIGTNVATLNADGVADKDNAPETNAKLTRVDVQIDCYGDNAFDYAHAIETYARSARCNDWLQQNGMALRVLYASDPINGTMIDETAQYVPRWITTLSVEVTVSITEQVPWFEEIDIVINDEPQPEPVKPKPQPEPPTPPPPEHNGIHFKNIDVDDEIEME